MQCLRPLLALLCFASFASSDRVRRLDSRRSLTDDEQELSLENVDQMQKEKEVREHSVQQEVKQEVGQEAAGPPVSAAELDPNAVTVNVVLGKLQDYNLPISDQWLNKTFAVDVKVIVRKDRIDELHPGADEVLGDPDDVMVPSLDCVEFDMSSVWQYFELYKPQREGGRRVERVVGEPSLYVVTTPEDANQLKRKITSVFTFDRIKIVRIDECYLKDAERFEKMLYTVEGVTGTKRKRSRDEETAI